MLTGLSVARHCGMIDVTDDVYLVHVDTSTANEKPALKYSFIDAKKGEMQVRQSCIKV